MLKLLNGQDNPVLNIDNFYIDELWSGLDELVFDIPITDPAYKSILEEAVVEYEQPYLVKAIDGGSSTAKVKCQLNVDAFREAMHLSYTNGSDTVAGTIEKVLPAGWMIIDHAHITSRRTIELEAATPLEIIQECEDTYGIIVRYDVKAKQLHIWDPDSFSPIGAFASRDLNLKEVNYKGKSSDFATRLYGYGKDDLSVAAINGGKPYVENFTYSDKVISAYWKDERYTVQENLLADMKRKLKEMSVPSVSYSCSVLDLAKTNPELYGHQNFELMQVVKLVDDIKGQCLNHQVVQYRRYPFYP
ncbi:MAG: phage tail spike protein, partial [Lachnospiraceae bacterium]|nr:phage tail spike protein [Lachnospiraceae bacterium]